MDHDATVRGLGVSVGDEGTGAPIVLLGAADAVVPIFVSSDQAQSIQHALDGEPFERPLTHDLLVDVVTELGGAIDRVRVDDLAEGTFYAKIHAEEYRDGERRALTFDARPSDAIAIALRLDCPILISETVVEEAGRSPEEFDFTT
ncbi:MAG: bifunctional nuclease family protein [Haloarculaceae archaeon]